MNKQTHSAFPVPHSTLEDASPAQLAFLALNGSYGEKLVATMLLESTCRAEASERRLVARPEVSESVIQAFPKGRWTV